MKTSKMADYNVSIDSGDIVMYDSNDIQNIFKCGKRQTYELLNTHGFPSIRIGAKFYVEKNALNRWLTQNQGRQVMTEKY